MSNELVVNDEDSQTRNTPDIFKSLCTLQEHDPAEALTILQAFLHLSSPFNHREYPNDFIHAQLALLKRLSPSPHVPLTELLRQLVPRSEWILSLNVIRQSAVELWITQFRKEYHKQKWSGNSEKIQALASLIERSLNLFHTREHAIATTANMWYSTALHLFASIIDELNEYLKNKLDKQQQSTPSLLYLIKPLGHLCEQLSRIEEKSSCLIIHDYFCTLFLANLQQRIDFIVNKKLLDQFESGNKLEAYTCLSRHTVFLVHPEFAKLLTLLNEARVASNRSDLIEKCNEQLRPLVEKVSNLFLAYPSGISLEHCVYLLSSLSSIASFFQHDQYEYFLHNFCQFLLTYWQVTLLHDCDAGDWLNSKAYFESTRYSVYIDTLFHHFTRFHTYVQRYCSSLLSIIVPFMLLELMHFIQQRYASIKVSYARQNQYKIDLLAFLLHVSEYVHYFLVHRTSPVNFVLFPTEDIQARFFQCGNEILTAISLVTSPIHILQEELQDIDQYRNIFPSKMTWLNVIRPDWFESGHEEIRSNVLIFLTIKKLLETRDNHIPLNHLLPFILENAQFNPCRVPLMYLMMKSEQWSFIDTFVQHEHDWSFLTSPSTKSPEWLSGMMKYWQDFFFKCCYLCVSEKEIPWQAQLRSEMDTQHRLDEESIFLKSLPHYLANLPLSLHHLLQAMSQHQPQVNKRHIFAHLLYKFMVEHKIDRSPIYYSFLTGQENSAYPTIERLLDRKSLLLRDPHDQVHDEQTGWQNSQHIYSVLHEHFDIIRTRLGVKRLDESYNISPSYPQTLNPRQRQFAQSTENLHLDSVKSNVTFMDFNPLTSKRSVDATNVNLKIDYTLVNRVELDWALLFSNLVVQLKSTVIYHLVTLRFELQHSSASSLNDVERAAVGKLLELLPRFLDARR